MTKESASHNSKDLHPFFLFSKTSTLGPSFGFFGASQKPPPPPPVEVPFSEEVLAFKSHTESVLISDGQHELTLLKGRVSASDVFGVSNSDLEPGKYEGGLKLWEGSIDLVKTLLTEIRNGQLTFKSKRILELGCGHALPGIFARLEGATTVHFQDFNAEVLRFLTIPNVKLNLLKALQQSQAPGDNTKVNVLPDVRFFAGDWSEIHHLLLHDCDDVQPIEAGSDIGDDACNGYDVILMAETVYEVSSLQSLYELIKKCLRRPNGVIYMAGKKHYFGVGGGTRQFVHLIEEDGKYVPLLLSEVADGSSNVREVWKLSYK
ncbi:hypothetical protein AXF42_Ash007594 [Apostasia shenzhenica]|uniref:protein-histidine N-methyltransferase n=1 Tax=Apostasia shenzhenica TaxID=1088818 RepID=A0A2I0A5W5_9ASPA|nr:hypothetical protein AXF42_Ash007594 [Apostasia shenzhenica]